MFTLAKWQQGLAFTLVTVSMWSVLPLFLQSAMKSMTPLSLNFFRFAGSGFMLGCWLLWRRRKLDWRGGSPLTWGMFGLAVLGLAANYAFYIRALHYISPSVAQVVIQVAPVLLTLLSVLLFRESFQRWQVLGLLGLVAGLGLFFNRRLSELLTARGDFALGVGLIAAAGLTWVVFALCQKVLLRRVHPSHLMVGVYSMAALIFLPFAQWQGFSSYSWQEWLVLAWCILNTLIAYGAFAEAMERWQASRVSAVLSLVPLLTIGTTAVAEAWLPGYFIYEELNLLSLVGALLVVIGALSVALAGRVASESS